MTEHPTQGQPRAPWVGDDELVAEVARAMCGIDYDPGGIFEAHARAAIPIIEAALLRDMTERFENNWGSTSDWIRNCHDYARERGLEIGE